MTEYQSDPVIGELIRVAIDVHRILGPGLLESTYQACVDHDLRKLGRHVQRQVAVPVVYKDIRLECGYRLDLLIDGDIIMEIKSVEKLLPIHTAQVLTYLRLTGARRALLINFNGPTLKQGLKSYVGSGNLIPPGTP